MSVPVLMITFNRFHYTKIALQSLFEAVDVLPFIVDNHSTDGTLEYLKQLQKKSSGGFYFNNKKFFFNSRNIGISGAFNMFLENTEAFQYVGKADNDTRIPRNFIPKMLPHMAKADLVQAKHPLIAASKVGTFDEWVSNMPQDGALRYSTFIGGSGILCRRDVLTELTYTENKLMAWRQWQREHPELRKAFATDVEIELLDEKGYEDYPEYYKMTGRC